MHKPLHLTTERVAVLHIGSLTIYYNIQILHLALDEVPVPGAVDLLVLQEDTVTLTCTHEVVIAGARGQAAAHRGSWPLTLLTALKHRPHTHTHTCSSYV